MLATTIDNAITGDTTTIASKPATASPLKRSLGISAHEWQGSIHHEGRWFKDAQGRTLLLRGVNLSGSSKLPTSPYPGSTHLYDDKLFWDHRNVSFIGRPFPLEDARLHFARLRAWGLTLIRLLVPWESIEHKGPGEYDEEYIDYLRELIAMMPEYGLKCFIDPHQDTWSRFSGGSGAPGWTFEIAGMDIRNFKETGAAYVHNTNAVPGDQLPMVWPTNYTKLASCTMFTLFFGGDTFAPHHRYNGQSIQQFLSQSYINAFVHLAERLKDMEAVMGLEVMNEPHPGYIGLDNLDAFDPIVNLVFGDSPTPLQCFALGDGIPQTVDVYVKSWPIPTRKSHSRLMNESKTSAWLPGHSCIWKKHGVWKIDDRNGKPVLLDTKYFSKHPETGEPIEFYRDFYVPFVEKYAQAIKNVKADWYCLVEPLANEKAPVVTSEGKNIVYAPHWYDLYCLFYKKFDARMTHDVQLLQNGGNVIAATYFGRTGAKANYRRQIQNIKNSGLKNIGETPCIIGEVGIPMDLNEKRAFTTGDYKHHLHNMDAVMHALETNLVNFTLWNYDPCNDHEYGDHWNGENFSIYSSPQSKDKQSHADDDDDLASLETLPNEQAQELFILELYKGGRVLAAVIRPYATKVSGTPLESRFDLDSLTYYFAFRPSAVAATTEIFVPQFHYGDKRDDISVQVSHGKWQYIPERQTLYHEYISDPTIDTITIHIRSELPASSSSTCVIV